MLHYFYVIEAAIFSDRLLPALAACRVRRSFAPLADLRPLLTLDADAALLAQAPSLTYDRHVFQAVVGQTLVCAARELPRLPLEPRVMTALIAPDALEREPSDRARLAPIQRAFFGSRDLLLGGAAYRPLHVGCNDAAVARFLADYLQTIDPTSWSPDSLERIDDLKEAEDRAEELALVRDWWPDFVDLYKRASADGAIIVCESTA